MSEYIEFVVRVPKDEADFFIARFGRKNVKILGYLLGEEIVRCRDCMKWHHIDTLDGVRYGECDEWKRADSYCVPATRESGFCAWAICKCGEDIELGNRESAVCPSCGRTVIE